MIFNLKVIQSADGKSLTIEDQSDYEGVYSQKELYLVVRHRQYEQDVFPTVTRIVTGNHTNTASPTYDQWQHAVTGDGWYEFHLYLISKADKPAAGSDKEGAFLDFLQGYGLEGALFLYEGESIAYTRHSDDIFIFPDTSFERSKAFGAYARRCDCEEKDTLERAYMIDALQQSSSLRFAEGKAAGSAVLKKEAQRQIESFRKGYCL